MYDGPPVVVVGNGPVGQTTALLLARWGVPTVVLDVQQGRAVVGWRSICQQRDVLDVWDTVGAARRTADEGVTWRVARTYFREHELFRVRFTDPGSSPFPPWVNIPQSGVEQILDDCLARTPAVDVRWAHRVTGLTDLGDRVVVEVETPDGPARLETPYVVGCAGARGDVVRTAVGTVFEGRSLDDEFLICDVRWAAVEAVLTGLAVPWTAVTLPADVARELGAAPGEVWLVRPDAHVAAVLAGGSAVADAVRGELGRLPGRR